MGNRLIFLVLAMVVFLTGCDIDRIHTTRYIYVNESGVDIVINQYFDDEIRERDEINPGKSFEKEYAEIAKEIMPFNMRWKVDVIFNNEKYISYEYEDEYDELNIYFKRNYMSIPTTEKLTTVYKYTFTPEMYESAEPIEEQ